MGNAKNKQTRMGKGTAIQAQVIIISSLFSTVSPSFPRSAMNRNVSDPGYKSFRQGAKHSLCASSPCL